MITSRNAIAEIAALIGDPARVNILSELMSGEALTAGELARAAGVSAQTASGHLAKLRDGGLVVLESQQGRHRYFRLASQEVAQIMESLSVASANGAPRYRPPGPGDEAMRVARSCYDHLAGRLGTRLADALCRNGHIEISEGMGVVTVTGQRLFCEFGIDLDRGGSKRPLCRTCIDWSERRPHLAGRLGTELLGRTLELGWVARMPGSRALRITQEGLQGFANRFGVVFD